MEFESSIEVNTVDMHTGGEPLRILSSKSIRGARILENAEENGMSLTGPLGNTILDKRRYLKTNMDHLRKFLMFEPRGHFDQYGALLVEPDDKQKADFGVIFMHNEGYSTMCGHAIIALGRYAIDHGLAHPTEERLSQKNGQEYCQVNIQCPCGIVKADVEMKDGKPGSVTFTSVPSFAFAVDVEIQTTKFGKVVLDIGYGGAFYALVSADKLGLNVSTSPINDLIDAADEISTAVKGQLTITHPEEADLSFLYGTILTDGLDSFSAEPTANLCVFADRQVDRCPTGSGVTARLAVQYAKKMIGLNEERKFINSKVKSPFLGKVLNETKCGELDAVNVQVTGHAYYTGKSTFTIEKDDPIGNGFLLR